MKSCWFNPVFGIEILIFSGSAPFVVASIHFSCRFKLSVLVALFFSEFPHDLEFVSYSLVFHLSWAMFQFFFTFLWANLSFPMDFPNRFPQGPDVAAGAPWRASPGHCQAPEGSISKLSHHPSEATRRPRFCWIWRWFVMISVDFSSKLTWMTWFLLTWMISVDFSWHQTSTTELSELDARIGRTCPVVWRELFRAISPVIAIQIWGHEYAIFRQSHMRKHAVCYDGNEMICLNKANHDSYFATHMDSNKLNGVKSCLIMGHDIMVNIRR